MDFCTAAQIQYVSRVNFLMLPNVQETKMTRITTVATTELFLFFLITCFLEYETDYKWT